MQAALPWLLPDYAELHRRMLPAIDAAIAFLVRAQVQSGPHAGGIPWSLVLLACRKNAAAKSASTMCSTPSPRCSSTTRSGSTRTDRTAASA